MTQKLALQWLPCQAPGVIWSALGLVGPVSLYCDWVRWKVWSAASMSVWQHVKLSEQIRPCDTLACCWDVKQPTNKTVHGVTGLMKHVHHLSWTIRSTTLGSPFLSLCFYDLPCSLFRFSFCLSNSFACIFHIPLPSSTRTFTQSRNLTKGAVVKTVKYQKNLYAITPQSFSWKTKRKKILDCILSDVEGGMWFWLVILWVGNGYSPP